MVVERWSIEDDISLCLRLLLWRPPSSTAYSLGRYTTALLLAKNMQFLSSYTREKKEERLKHSTMGSSIFIHFAMQFSEILSMLGMLLKKPITLSSLYIR